MVEWGVGPADSVSAWTAATGVLKGRSVRAHSGRAEGAPCDLIQLGFSARLGFRDPEGEIRAGDSWRGHMRLCGYVLMGFGKDETVGGAAANFLDFLFRSVKPL